MAESLFGTFKTELGEDFAGAADATTQAFDHIELFYDQQRNHPALADQSRAATSGVTFRPTIYMVRC